MRFLFFVILVLALAGCDNSKNAAEPAAPNTPPTSNENLKTQVIYRSPQKVALDEAAERARERGTVVIIKVSAGWCGPCAMVDEKLSQETELVEQLKQEVEFLKYDEMNWVDNYGLVDFLPGGTALYFPSFYLYDPANNFWMLFRVNWYYDEELKVAQELMDVAKRYKETGKGLSGQHISEIEEKLDSGAPFAGEEDLAEVASANVSELGSAIQSAAIENGAEGARLLLKTLDLIENDPKRFNLSTIGPALAGPAAMLFSDGHIERETIDRISLGQANYRLWYAYNMKFKGLVRRSLNQGRAAAYQTCMEQKDLFLEETAKPLLADLINEGGDEDDIQWSQEFVDTFQQDIFAICERFGIQSRTLTSEQVLERYQSLPEDRQGGMSLAKNLALAGHFDLALGLLNAEIEVHVNDLKDAETSEAAAAEQLASLRENLEEATNAGDQEKIDQLNTEIEEQEGELKSAQHAVLMSGRKKASLEGVREAWTRGTMSVTH